MDLIILGLSALTIVGLLTAFCYLVFKKGGPFREILICLPGIFIMYHVYGAIFPADDFFEYEFSKVSGAAYPVSGKVLKKHASFPDLHGDYESCALIQFSAADYDNLKKYFEHENAGEKARYSGICDGSSDWKPFEIDDRYLKVVEKSGGEIKRWGLLKEKNIVFIEYSSW